MIRLAAVALLAATPALAAERSYPVAGFDKLALEGSPDVTVTTGKAVGVHATGDEAVLDKLDVRVEGGVLKIGHKRTGFNWDWGNHVRTRFAITVPMLRAVDIAGSGAVTVDRVKAPDFAGNIAGSGSLKVAALDAERTKFDISGSGTMTAAGRCGAGSAEIAGSGDLKLSTLRCATLSASIAGSGSIDAFATQTATLSIMGSGDIRLTGGARCTVSSAGSGKTHCS